jgi:hypothetical protein
VGADAEGAEVKLLRRRQPEPEPLARDEWADLLRRYRTRSSPEMQREVYQAEARARQKARAGATPTPTPPTGGVPYSLRTHGAPAPQPRAENASAPPAPFSQLEPWPTTPPGGPARFDSRAHELEQLRAFYLLGGLSGDELDEAVREAVAFDEDDVEPEPYVWSDGFS